MKIAGLALALAAGAARADHPAGDQPPTCEALSIADEAGCADYCAKDGHDGQFYDGEFGVSCKCDMSEPGDAFDAYDFVNACYTEPFATEEEGSASGDKVEKEDEGAYGATTYASAGEEARCYCGEVRLACDRMEIECSNGLLSSGGPSLGIVGAGLVVGAVAAALGCC